MKRDFVTFFLGGVVCYIFISIVQPLMSSTQQKTSPPASTVQEVPHECDCENEYYRRELHKQWSENEGIIEDVKFRLIFVRGGLEQIRNARMMLIRDALRPTNIRPDKVQEKEKARGEERETQLEKEFYTLCGKQTSALDNLTHILLELRNLGDYSRETAMQGILADIKSDVEKTRSLAVPWLP